MVIFHPPLSIEGEFFNASLRLKRIVMELTRHQVRQLAAAEWAKDALIGKFPNISHRVCGLYSGDRTDEFRSILTYQFTSGVELSLTIEGEKAKINIGDFPAEAGDECYLDYKLINLPEGYPLPF